MNYLKELNPAQQEAVVCNYGPVMIIAGAGSGKTRVLTYRVAWLIDQGVDPFKILALTFTNKAAKEMRWRIEQITGSEARNIWMGTFHSIFARILRYEAEKIGFPQNFTIYDTYDSRSLLKQIIREQNLDEKLYKPNIVHNRISKAKNSLISPKDYQKDIEITSEDESSGRPKLGELYEIYWNRCFKAGAMDFDDLLYRMYLLLEKFPDILYKYQNFYEHMLVDEYQDTNHAQYVILRKLADVHQNIWVVGDDAQSIYAFRGANIQNIFAFQKDYPDHQTYKLEQNYRSTKNILDAANDIIRKNKKQIKKKLWTGNDGGDKIILTKSGSDNEEGKLISNSIFEQKMRNHMANTDFAILYRTNAQSRAFEEALRKLNVPYKVYGGLSFYQRKEIKDLIAYLRLTLNHYDEESLRRIINYPTRGIGKTTIEKATVLAHDNDKSLWDILADIGSYDFTQRAKQSITDFVTMIKSFYIMLETKNAFDLSMHIAKSTRILQDLYDDKSVEGLSRYENIQELLNGIKEFTIEENEAVDIDDKSLGTYLQNITLLTDADLDETDQDTVSLMTLHAAKGLEFPNVYIVGLEENLFPSIMALNSRIELEEERRLFYVGITRAKKRLHLSYAITRFKFGKKIYCEPSRFIKEISPEYIEGKEVLKNEMNWADETPRKLKKLSSSPQQGAQKPTFNSKAKYIQDPNFVSDDLMNIQNGMQVEHQRFGFGKVIHLEGDASNKIATIFFQEQGQKRIMLKYAKLKIHDTIK